MASVQQTGQSRQGWPLHNRYGSIKGDNLIYLIGPGDIRIPGYTVATC